MDDDVLPEGDEMRPTEWSDYIGQDAIKRQLDIRIRGAMAGERRLDHTLLAGPPGAGKTTLAQIVASRLGDPFYAIDHPVKLSELWAIIKHMGWGILFIDEIHRFGKPEQENLLTLLHEGYLQMGSRVLEVPWITVIAATTEPERVTKAVRSRFPVRPRFVDYSDGELRQIVLNMSTIADLDLSEADAEVLGRAAAGIPRNAKDLVLAGRDIKAAMGETPTAEEILDLQGVELDGLDADHMHYLKVLDRLGGWAGIQKVADHMRLDPGVLRDLERLLLKYGLISYDRGRTLTPGGYARLRTGTPERATVHPRALASRVT